MGHYVALDTLYGSLKELSIEDLKGMLSDDPKVQSYFEANIPSVKEKQELVRQIKSQNIASANENVEAKKALDRLEAEVMMPAQVHQAPICWIRSRLWPCSLRLQVVQLRKLVADRQAQIVPGASEIQEADSVSLALPVLVSCTSKAKPTLTMVSVRCTSVNGCWRDSRLT